MKKVTIIGIRDSDVSPIVMSLINLGCDFMVEHVEDDEPPAMQQAAISLPPPPPMYPERAPRAKPGMRLHDIVMAELAGGPVTREKLRQAAERHGYKATSIQPLLSELKREGVIRSNEDRTLEMVKHG